MWGIISRRNNRLCWQMRGSGVSGSSSHHLQSFRSAMDANLKLVWFLFG